MSVLSSHSQIYLYIFFWKMQVLSLQVNASKHKLGLHDYGKNHNCRLLYYPLVFVSLYFSQIPARSRSDTDKVVQ